MASLGIGRAVSYLTCSSVLLSVRSSTSEPLLRNCRRIIQGHGTLLTPLLEWVMHINLTLGGWLTPGDLVQVSNTLTYLEQRQCGPPEGNDGKEHDNEGGGVQDLDILWVKYVLLLLEVQSQGVGNGTSET